MQKCDAGYFNFLIARYHVESIMDSW